MMSRNVIHVIRHNADFKICGLNFLGCPGMFFSQLFVFALEIKLWILSKTQF